MSRNRVLQIVFALVFLAAGGAGAWRLAFASDRAKSSPSDLELAALRLEVSEMKRLLRNPKTPGGLPILANAPSSLVQPRAEGQSESSDRREHHFASAEEVKEAHESRREEAAKRQQERREHFDAVLQSEPRDLRWGAEATKAVEGWLTETTLADFSLTELDCRSSMCRARFGLPDGKGTDEFLLATMNKVATFQQTSLHVVDHGGGRRELVAYLGRSGEALPQ